MMVGLLGVAEHLRQLDGQFVHQRDNPWSKMVEVVEKMIAWMDEDDREETIDDRVAKGDRLQTVLIVIATG